MSFDVVVVGGGIGGLTVAALLSARGVETCLLERNSQVGGCIARVEFSGHDFEPGMGLYTSFGSGETYDSIFTDLPAGMPESSLLASPYVVRLADGTDVRLARDDSFFDELKRTFPECSEQAIIFYQTVAKTAAAWSRPANGKSDGLVAKTLRSFWPKTSLHDLQRATKQTALDYARETSPAFKAFIDAQLRAFLHTTIDRCSFLAASVALSLPRSDLYAIAGGPAALAERFADSIKQSGGTVRLNSPVLRLSYSETGHAIGVDLLSGETVAARKAIVSNLTIWDTYGKLVGLNRIPAEIRKVLNMLQGTGAYLVYASLDEQAVSRLPGERFLAAGGIDSDAEAGGEFTVAISAANDRSAPAGKRAVTLKTRTEAADWFSFQVGPEDNEQRDQTALEGFWERLHAALPELGADIEVIETANPRTYYDLTRRKLGMVMGVEPTPENFGMTSRRTFLPNLFMVGDTVDSCGGLHEAVRSARAVADKLTG